MDEPEKLICSRCGAEHTRKGQRLCPLCHTINMQKHRRKVAAERHQDTADLRAIARVVARYANLSGEIEKSPCEVCGDPDAEMHHPDHEMSKFVISLCRRHHMLWHEHWKHTVLNCFADWLYAAREGAQIAKDEEKETNSHNGLANTAQQAGKPQ